ncbi:uncharacterized mitochondrial protein-like protein, partial [Tanacetum coccineum]
EELANVGKRNDQEKEGGASNKDGDQNVQDLRAELDKLIVQQKEAYANSTNRVYTITPSVSAAGKSFVNDLPTNPLMPNLEDTTDLLNIGIFSGAYDDEDVGAEADLNNFETTMNVSPIPITRIHKDHPKEQIIEGLLLAPQTRRLTKSSQEHAKFPDKVYKVEKALYGLHQAPKAWYETLSTYLLENGFRKGTIDKTLFIKKDKGDILLVQVYVDDIIFGSTKKSLCVEFEQMMHKRFRMSSMRELTFFLGLQVKQKDDGIFISQDKYVVDILKKFDFVIVKTTNTPIETNKALLKDEEAEDVDVHLYRSMIGSLMYLTASRPDILFAVCACARFQVTPKVSHLHAVKRIFRYLKNHIRFALTKNPTIYVSLIKKFWQTATVRRIDNGEQKITAIVDGKEFTITEASIRRHLLLGAEMLLGAKKPHGVIYFRTRLRGKVESLEAYLKQTKQVYGAAYTKLIMKVKKLEKTVKTSQARRRAKIVVSDDEEDLEDSSKQGRMIDEN